MENKVAIQYLLCIATLFDSNIPSWLKILESDAEEMKDSDANTWLTWLLRLGDIKQKNPVSPILGRLQTDGFRKGHNEAKTDGQKG